MSVIITVQIRLIYYLNKTTRLCICAKKSCLSFCHSVHYCSKCCRYIFRCDYIPEI